MNKFPFLFIAVLFFVGCSNPTNDSVPPSNQQEEVQVVQNCDYLNVPSTWDVKNGGVKMVELKEGYKVWTKRYGNSDMKVLILHGGPALTHEYLESFQSFFPQANIEFYEYDQLGSFYSDQPDDDSLWTIERFVDEIEQVRVSLGLNQDNFFLLGNSWGGILAMEYALKYDQNLKGLLISGMTADFDKYEAYNAMLRSKMRPSLIDSLEYYENKGLYHDPVYADLVFNEYYTQHICRLEEWPEPVLRSFDNINQHVYEYMQGPSEFVPGGILKHWSVWDDLHKIETPTLMIGAEYDTMNPKEMEEMSHLVQNGEYLHCPNGSHLCFWDDQEVYMNGVIDFIHRIGSK